MKRVCLFINGKLGLQILEYLISLGDLEIFGIVVNALHKRSPDYLDKISDILIGHNKNIFVVSADQEIDIDQILESCDWGISALYGHIITERQINIVNGNLINLHPSALPIGRGSDPIPWAIIEGKSQGVSIHFVDKGLDTGDIIFQKTIKTNMSMNSGQIYELAMEYLYCGFKEIWPLLIAKEIKPQKQIGESTFHVSKDLESLKVIDISFFHNAQDFINLVQALSFSDGRKALIRDGSGTIWSITMNINKYD